MEGLIPFIYKQIKKRRNRKYYKVSATHWFGLKHSFRVSRPKPIQLGSGDDHQHLIDETKTHQSAAPFPSRSHSFNILRPTSVASPTAQEGRSALSRSSSFGIRLPSIKLGGGSPQRHQPPEDLSVELSTSPEMNERRDHLAKDARHGNLRFLSCVRG